MEPCWELVGKGELVGEVVGKVGVVGELVVELGSWPTCLSAQDHLKTASQAVLNIQNGEKPLGNGS